MKEIVNRVCILDRHMNAMCPTGKGYPHEGDGHIDSFVAMLHMYYMMTGTDAKEADLETVARFDTTQPCMGPFVINGHSRVSSKELILKSVVTALNLGGGSAQMPRELPGGIGVPQCHFVTWKLFKKKQHVLREMFWNGVTDVFADDFACVGKTSGKNISICEHDITGAVVSSHEERRALENRELNAHVTICLRKRLVGETRGTVRMVHANWYSLPETATRDSLTQDQWSTLHPYFKGCTYTDKGIIKLSKAELKKLPKALRRTYSDMVDMMLTPDGISKATAELQQMVLARVNRCVSVGGDGVMYAMLAQWTLPELLKCYATPPPLRPHPDKAGLQFTANHQHTAFDARQNMYVLTHKKNKKDEILVVRVQAGSGLDTFLQTNYPHATRREDIMVLSGKHNINAMLLKLAEALFFPADSIIGEREPRVEDVEFKHWQSFIVEDDRNRLLASGLSAAAASTTNNEVSYTAAANSGAASSAPLVFASASQQHPISAMT